MPNMQNVFWPGWETVKLIGRGSFGVVYEIQRDVFGDIEKAALKVISIPQHASDIDEMYSDGYDDESITSTFQDHLKSIVAEYSLMKKMTGSLNIVHCDDIRYIQHDNGFGWDIFIKMELLTPLTKALPAEVPEEMVVKLAKDMCAALELCRKHGIVHRDIKPQNIFLSSNGDYKLGDFGIAKTVEKTMGGTKIGTYKYMAPEVYNNQPYGMGADIYSLGLVLYWMLNERRMPFVPLPPARISIDQDSQAKHRRFTGEPLPAPTHGSENLKRVVLKACAFDPKDRYQTAQEMWDALESIDRPMPKPETRPTVVLEEDEDEKTVRAPASYVPADHSADDEVTVGARPDVVSKEREKRLYKECEEQSKNVQTAAEPQKQPKKILWLVIAAACILVILVIGCMYDNGLFASTSSAQPDSVATPENHEHKNVSLEKLEAATVGDYVVFGKYEQDNNTSNGNEDIEWLVLDVQEDKILVISKYALDCKPYNQSDERVTWETCTLRQWLNNEFLNAAFSGGEQAIILGNAMQDQVFLLGADEANEYFNSDSERECEPTVYAKAQGAYVSSAGNGRWWLRPPARYLNTSYVSFLGSVYDLSDMSVNADDCAVRPAMWINLEN